MASEVRLNKISKKINRALKWKSAPALNEPAKKHPEMTFFLPLACYNRGATPQLNTLHVIFMEIYYMHKFNIMTSNFTHIPW